MLAFLARVAEIAIGVGLCGFIAGRGFDAYEAICTRHRAERHSTQTAYESYLAVHAIQEARRNAIRDLIVAERRYRHEAPITEVIQGTAVEVER